MPTYPQYANAVLVTAANFVKTVLTGSAGASISANSGDVQIIEVNAVNVSGTAVVTLPAAALGGPVLVKFSHSNGNTAFGTAARVRVAPNAADTAAGTLIDGFGTVIIQNLGDQLLLASDGVQWWSIEKELNTAETW